MSTEKDDFPKKLRATFKVEAAEHLRAIATGLLALEQTPAQEAQRKIVEAVFRAAHSLKGAARAVDFAQIESLCQSLEDVFAGWKRQESVVPSPTALDTLHRTLDAIAAVMSEPEAKSGMRVSVPQPSFNQPIRHPEVPAPTAVVLPEPVAEQKTFLSQETVRIAVARLDARLLEAEEILTDADPRDLAKAATAAAKLGEVERRLGEIGAEPRAAKVRAYVREQIRKLRLASLSAV